MNGYKSGVKKRLEDAVGKTVPYVHCFNHRLRLVIIDTVRQISSIREFFDQIQLIYHTFKKPKITKIYEGSKIIIKNLIETRWTGHFRATISVCRNFRGIVETLNKIKHDKEKTFQLDGDDIAICTGILNVHASFHGRILVNSQTS